MGGQTNEVWRVYPHNDNYEVSNMGRVRRANDLNGGGYKRGGLLKPYKKGMGYTVVNLCKDREIKQIVLHILVLETFVGLCPLGMECNHKDGVKVNNKLGNLEWVTPLENMRHAKEMGLLKPAKGERNGNAKNTRTSIVKIRRLYKTGDYSMRKLAVKFGIHNSTVCQIINKKTWR